MAALELERSKSGMEGGMFPFWTGQALPEQKEVMSYIGVPGLGVDRRMVRLDPLWTRNARERL